MLVIRAGVALVAAVGVIPEPRARAARSRLTPVGVLRNCGGVLKNTRFLGMSLSAGLLMGTLFGYISASAFVFMTYFGLSASNYSLIFAVNSVGMILAGQLNLYLCRKMSSRRNLAFGFTVHLFFTAALLAAVAAGFDSLEIVGVLLFLATSSLCLLFGGITAESMYSVEHSRAGSASAVLGVLQYAIGGGAGLVLGLVHNNTLIPLVVLMAACSTLSLCSWALAADKKLPLA